jgi:hypothetical protein
MAILISARSASDGLASGEPKVVTTAFVVAAVRP